jgi:hypothetical protein
VTRRACGAWRWDAERTVKFNGTTPGNGGSATRTLGDGSSDSFKYVTVSDGHRWVWTDGSTREVETYGDSTNASTIGRLLNRTDITGIAISQGCWIHQ